MATSKIKKPTTTYLNLSDIVMQEHTKNYDIVANGSTEINFNVAKTGYIPFGMVGFNGGGQVFCVSCARAANNGTTFTMTIKNTSGTAFTARTARVDILYVKIKS